MGGSPIRHEDLTSYYHSSPIREATSSHQVFRETKMSKLFDPAEIKLPREARDSALSPHSRGIILAEDVTGSMDAYILDLIQNRFPDLIQEIYKIATYNPHIMFMGVGDVEYDDAPLQVTQFETDLRMLEQLQRIWIEGGGGGNSYESYILPWFFAGNCISMDCYEKRGEKGFLFTFGDEKPTPAISSYDLKKVFGNRKDVPIPSQRDIYFEDCLEMASEKFHCYHIILPGWHRLHYPDVVKHWKERMGGHACDLTEPEYLTELITTILKIHNGVSKTMAISSIKNITARAIVENALYDHEEMVDPDSLIINGSASIEEF